eukprot:215748-Rhodomonas_salina.1
MHKKSNKRKVQLFKAALSLHQESQMPEDAAVKRRFCWLTCPTCPRKDNQVSTLLTHPFLQIGVCVKCIEFNLDKGRELRNMETQRERNDFNWSKTYCRVCGNGGLIYQCDQPGCQRGICSQCAAWYPRQGSSASSHTCDTGDCHPDDSAEGWHCPECVQTTSTFSVLCRKIQEQQCRDVIKCTSWAGTKGWPLWVKPHGNAEGKRQRE